MWENVKSFKALLMFAEHRYYGESLIDDSYEHLHHDQALADYAALLRSFKSNHSASESPVIVFGGSYGVSVLNSYCLIVFLCSIREC